MGFWADIFLVKLLFSCGYRPELYERIERQAVAAINKYRAEQKNGKAK